MQEDPHTSGTTVSCCEQKKIPEKNGLRYRRELCLVLCLVGALALTIQGSGLLGVFLVALVVALVALSP